MKKQKYFKFLFLIFTLSLINCRKNDLQVIENKVLVKNEIKYAKGLEIYNYKGYTKVIVKNPWPNATKNFEYILKDKNAKLPDSLLSKSTIQVPIKTIIATSTTHLPSLEMLNVQNTLIGFPNLNYISSKKIRQLIDTKQIVELGSNQSLNFEKALQLQPSVIIGYGIDNNNPTINNLTKSGLKVIINGDWNEQSPLGKAEWIKLFGAIYGKQKIADSVFKSIEKNYNNIKNLAQSTKVKPTVLAGALFENVWHVPQGESWGAQFLNDAGANYLWKNEKGTGGLSLSFEKVFEKAQNADFWIGPGQFTSLQEMEKNNPHYAQFKSFKNKKIFSYGLKKGATGGLIYFEEAPNRPDLVLLDLLQIIHPNIIKNNNLHFFEKLK